MNQFKPIFLNKLPQYDDRRTLKRAVNSQKCIRVGGKHCDLDHVGRDLKHHTFFEMLGNWSFGDYHKEEAYTIAWTLLTDIFKLNPNQLIVTYFGGDEKMKIPPDYETKEIWQRLGLQQWKIIPLGTKDNFWEMGHSGPCGVCTEIHYLPEPLLSQPSNYEQLLNKCIEIWNIVFIQYNRNLNGELNLLSNHFIDTGMGLERILAILQGVNSGYETDLFVPFFDEIQKTCKVKPYSNDLNDSTDIGYRVLSDHSRMFTVAISDGLIPNDFKSGYVLRKIIRKASWSALHDFKLPSSSELLCNLARISAKTLGCAFPELNQNLDFVLQTVDKEIHNYERSIDKVEKLFHMKVEENLKSGIKEFPCDYAFDLIHMFGANQSLIASLSDKYELSIDWDEIDRLEQEKIAKDQIAHEKIYTEKDYKNFADRLRHLGFAETNDSYKYDLNSLSSLNVRVIAIIKSHLFLDECKESDNYTIVTEKTNFYSEAGGQEPDHGEIISDSGHFFVRDVQKCDGFVFHNGTLVNGSILINDKCTLKVNQIRRHKCTQNHSATHILDSALKKVLSIPPVLYSPKITGEYIRFEYTYNMPLNQSQVTALDEFVNCVINTKLNVIRKIVPLNEIDNDVVTIPGEEYPDPITIVTIEDESSGNIINKSACCGTHVNNVSEIESFTIIQQRSVGLNKRVIRAFTGSKAQSSINRGKELLKKLLYINTLMDKLITNDFCDMKQVNCVRKEMSNIRTQLSVDNEIPLKIRLHLNTQLEDISERLKSVNKQQTNVTNNLIEEFKKEFQSIDTNTKPFIVHLIQTKGDLKTAFKVAYDHCGHLPSALFYRMPNQQQFYCQFTVPKDYRIYLSANDWFNSISQILHHKEIISNKRSDKFLSLKSNSYQQLDNAIELTEKCAQKYFVKIINHKENFKN